MSKAEAGSGDLKLVKKPKAVKKRVYQEQMTWESDLYRLKTAKMMKYSKYGVPQAARDPQEDYHKLDHEHLFHTVDSGGKPMETSHSVGGHFHVMTKISGEPGDVGEFKCSGPMMFKNIRGKQVMSPYDMHDTHTHEVVYERSSRVRPRTVNAEAVKILQAETEKATPPPEIVES